MNQSRLIRKEDIDRMLAQTPVQGKRQLQPLLDLFLAKNPPMGIVEDSAVEETFVEVHKHEHDLWFGLEGETEFTYGGKLVDPQVSANENELTGREIAGGTTIVFKSGDWLWIPAGVPHMHKTSGVARMVIIKIPATHS